MLVCFLKWCRFWPGLQLKHWVNFAFYTVSIRHLLVFTVFHPHLSLSSRVQPWHSPVKELCFSCSAAETREALWKCDWEDLGAVQSFPWANCWYLSWQGSAAGCTKWRNTMGPWSDLSLMVTCLESLWDQIKEKGQWEWRDFSSWRERRC